MTLPPEMHLLQPETGLEFEILATAEFQEGLHWGVPRKGHPEGMVILHVAEVLDNVNAMHLAPEDRALLRLVAICHDTFKYQEEQLAHDRHHQHHGILAAEFISQFAVDEVVLDLVRWHDEAYYAWRMTLMNMHDDAAYRFAQLHERMQPRWSLYDAFLKADTLTGDKNPAPLKWVAEQTKIRTGSFIAILQ